VRVERLAKLKVIHLIGTRTRDLPACSIVPQPTTLPRTLDKNIRDSKEGCILPAADMIRKSKLTSPDNGQCPK
jgi:hypothetical protein